MTSTQASRLTRKRAVVFVAIFLVAFGVRFLTMQFMKSHLHDPSWFQSGSYKIFDRKATNILTGQEAPFWISDATRTDLAQYPPEFPFWVELIYRINRDHTCYSVQQVQWV
jgi:hypothetical protein